MTNISVDPDVLYSLVREFNRKKFILNEAIREQNFILVRHYRREVERLRNIALKQYNIIIDEY